MSEGEKGKGREMRSSGEAFHFERTHATRRTGEVWIGSFFREFFSLREDSEGVGERQVLHRSVKKSS